MKNVEKSSGILRSSTPESGGANPRLAPVFGVVKNNIDPTRTGRIQVYIADFGSKNPDDSSSWCTVSFMSPFYGFVKPNAPNTEYGNYTTTPSSYGLWNSPPDIGTTVICIFVNGDLNYGFYIGCVPQAEALHMVPAIGASDNIIINTQGEGNGYGGASRLPVTNINGNNPKIADSVNFLQQPKPVHSYVAMIMNQQGLIRDSLRGPISTSAQRESPSRVGWGISTPGRPIYEGGLTDETVIGAVNEGVDPSSLRVVSRRGGHSIVLDDGDIIGRDQLVRIRSAAGHQILMSDDGQTLFIVHSNGQSYIELGKEGTIDMYSTNSFNVRTQGDINLHADNDINFHAAKKFNLYAEDINITSGKSTNQIVGTNFTSYTKGTFTHKIDDSMSMFAKGESSYASSSTMYINGSVINLNTGSTSVVPQVVQPITFLAHTDTLYDKVKGYAAAPAKLLSITSRAPAHMPWANAGQGVNVQTSNDASTELPESPISEVDNLNNEAYSTPVTNEVTPEILSSVPPLNPISTNIDATVTSGIVSAVSINAATGLANFAVKNGAGIVPTTQGNLASIGKLAFVPEQLEKAGILKPGSSSLVNKLINSGATIKTALPDNLFTGKNGITNLESFVNNTDVQVNTQVTVLQQAETDLINAGVLTGLEDGTSVAGVVMATSSAGVENVVSTLKTNTSFKTPTVPNVPNISTVSGIPNAGILNSIKTAVKLGNKAAKLAKTGVGPMSSISSAANFASNTNQEPTKLTRGPSAAAFGSILNSFKPLQVGVPQNLTEISNQQTAKTVASAAGGNQQTAQAVLGAVGQVTGVPIKQITKYFNDIVNSKDPGKTLKATGGLLNTVGKFTGDKSLRQLGTVANSSAGVFNSINKLNTAKNPTQTGNAVSSLLRDFGNISNAIGNPELSKSFREINTVVRAGTNAVNSIAKLNSSTNPAQAIRNVTGVVSSIGRIGSALGEPNLARSANTVNSVLNSTGQILRSADIIAGNKNPSTSVNEISKIVNSVNRISSVLTNSNKSTGLNALPGGQHSTGLVLNKITGKIPLPGTNKVSSAINNLSTATKNNISIENAKTFTEDRLNTDEVTDPKTTIKTVSASELPEAEAAQLNAALSAVSKVSANPVKLPTFALNTNNRTGVEQQIKSLLGNSKIPLPNFTGSGPSDIAKTSLEKSIQSSNALSLNFSELIKQNEAVEAAKKEYYEIESTFPPGDPAIDEARNRWLTLKQNLDNQFKAIINV